MGRGGGGHGYVPLSLTGRLIEIAKKLLLFYCYTDYEEAGACYVLAGLSLHRLYISVLCGARVHCKHPLSLAGYD